MAKIISRQSAGPDDPIFNGGFVISTIKRKPSIDKRNSGKTKKSQCATSEQPNTQSNEKEI
jgi:hypothetical protein